MPIEGPRRYACALLVCVVAFASAIPAAAQDSPRAHPGSSADFLFGRPRGSATFRGGWLFARAGSDLFDFLGNQLTIEDRDFHAPNIGGELGVAIGSRLEALFGVDYARSVTPSEYRRFVDNDNLPIAQETRLRTTYLTWSVKVPLRAPGARVSRLAWIPRGWTPYVGAGAGAVYYDFLQTGDFVDFVDLSVFPDVFHSKGWAPSAHVFGGADVQLYRLLFLQLEGRYTWAKGELDADFIDFDPIDLAGLRTTAGIRLLF